MTRSLFRLFASVLVLGVGASPARAVILGTGDASGNITAPGGAYAGSGWDLQGDWMGFTGTPIAPHYFITAVHVAGSPGTAFIFQGESHTTESFVDVPGTDLRIWRVTQPFRTYAPLYPRPNENGKELVVFGRGKIRGPARSGGWDWGGSDGNLRWGTNVVTDSTNQYLRATFDLAGSTNEATLATGDSGGGVFIKDTDGVWKLAGVNWAVSGPYKLSAAASNSTAFSAALYDETGLFVEQDDGSYAPGIGPGSFYASRISTNLAFITQHVDIPEPSSALLLLGGLAWGVATRPRSKSRGSPRD